MADTRWIVWVRNAALALVILAFIFFFGQPQGGAGLGVVAEVNGESVRREVFEFFREQNERVQRSLAQDGDAQALRDALDRDTLEALIWRYLLAQEARSLGLRVTDREITTEILADPGFRTEGRFDRELFERFLARSGLGSPHTYRDELERDLLLRKFRRVVQSPVRIGEERVEERVRQAVTTVRLRFVRTRAEDYRAGAEIGDAEVVAYLETAEVRLREAYAARLDAFRTPEEVRARHILFKGDDAAERAAAARERIVGGEEFAALARELSEDTATREQGGDLGFFPRDRMLPAFEAAAFGLAPGEVSEPVETERGVHLIRVEERRAAGERPFEEVAPDLAREVLAEERARGLAREAAEGMAARLAAGAGFEAAAREGGLIVEETGPFRYTDPAVPRLGRVPGLIEEAFGLTAASPVPRRLFETADGFLLVSLLERRDPDPADVKVQARETRDRLLLEARGSVLARWYRSRRDRLEREGKLRVYPLYPEAP
jgi:peptidyl-prolyl cis-trans isomerase D